MFDVQCSMFTVDFFRNETNYGAACRFAAARRRLPLSILHRRTAFFVSLWQFHAAAAPSASSADNIFCGKPATPGRHLQHAGLQTSFKKLDDQR